MFIDRFRKPVGPGADGEKNLFSNKCLVTYNQAKSTLSITMEKDGTMQEFTDITAKLDGIKKLPSSSAYPKITYEGENARLMAVELIKKNYSFSGAERLKGSAN